MGIKLIPSIKAIIHSSFVILIFTALFSNAWALETFANSKKDGVEVFTESKDWCAEEVRFIFKVKNQEQLNNEGLQLLVKKVGKLVESNCEVTEVFNISGGLTLEDLTYAATAKKSQDWNIENVEIDQDETQISQSTEQESKSDDETDENEDYVAPPTIDQSNEEALSGIWSIAEEPGFCYTRGWAGTTEPTKPNQQNTYVQVSLFPSMDYIDGIFFTIEYTYANKMNIEAQIDHGQIFILKQIGNKLLVSDVDRSNLLTAMREGTTLVVQGNAEDGELKISKFSLKGFEESYLKITKLCDFS